MSLSAAVLTSHSPRARLLTLNADGTTRTTYDPDRIVLSGSVSHDRKREVSRMASLTLVDRDGSLAPITYGEEFSQGERVRIERGARIAGYDTFTLLGTYEVASFEADTGGSLSLTAEDPSTALQQDMGEVVVIPAQTRAADIVRLLWEPVLGSSTSWDLDDDSMALAEARTIAETDQRLHVAIALMTDFGLELSVGRNGLPFMRAHADPATLPVTRTYRQANGEALATSIRRSGSRRPVNRQVVVGEGSSPVRAVADVTDLASPLHVSRIGLRPAPIYRSASITTQHQADTVARAMLIEAIMWTDSIIWVGVPDPSLEAGEVIAVTDAQTRTDAKYRVESVTIPVTQGPMSIEASRVVPLFT